MIPRNSPIPFREAVRAWITIALNSFGGPAAQIAVMHRVLVDERKWIGETRFLHALNYCMLLPGPEAMQLVTYMGWLLHGYAGGLVAGTLFVLPGFVAILALSSLYVAAAHVSLVAGLFVGLKAAVLAVVVQAVWRVGKRVLKHPFLMCLAVAAFVALFVFHVPFPYVILTAGIVGFFGSKLAPGVFSRGTGHGSAGDSDALADRLLENHAAPHMRPRPSRDLAVAFVLALLWVAPVLAFRAAGADWDVFFRQGVLFSKAAVLTFGGAYSVLPYVSQQAVEVYGWLTPGEMMDGLGMAETTPGPLIQVVQFVGAIGAWRNPGILAPWLALLVGSWMTVWVTYTPCFLWILAGAPYVEAVRGRKALAGALTAITAAVVGVIANLAVWFALHVIFASVSDVSGPLGVRLALPDWDSVQFVPLVLAVGAFVALTRHGAGMIRTIVACAALGLVAHLVAG
ncbi:MAG: chromate efflux transporter [Deltaproteobacteria bacterium]|nr:chromate efflux transporter [Deltaproteobacteria bacterium]